MENLEGRRMFSDAGHFHGEIEPLPESVPTLLNAGERIFSQTTELSSARRTAVLAAAAAKALWQNAQPEFEVGQNPIAQGGLPNLAVIDTYMSDAAGNRVNTPAVGSYAYMTTIYSTENIPAGESYTVRMRVGGVDVEVPTNWGAGESGVHAYEMRLGVWLMTPGFKSAQVFLDDNGDITEINGADNIGDASFTPATFSPKFVYPLEGTPFVDWSIGNYVDMNIDPEPGQLADYRGGTFVYNGHNGWDMGPASWRQADAGFDVRAAAGGTVDYVEDGHYDRNYVAQGQPSNYVVIDHNNGWKTVYHHMRRDSIVVADGQSVVAGQKIGFVGSSGNSTGQHLHFAVYYNGMQVEPNVSESSYFHSPIGYSADHPTVLASGVNSYDASTPFDEFVDGPTFSDVLRPGEIARGWASPAGINAGDDVSFVWRRPDNSIASVHSFDSGQMQGGYWGSNFGVPPIAQLGDWSMAVNVNGTEKSRTFFTVNLDGAPQARMFKSTFVGPGYVIDGRSTPFNFGTIKQFGTSQPSQSFGVLNSGALNLTTTTPTVPAGFTQTSPLSANIAPGATDTYSIRLDNTTPGHKIGKVTFLTNDIDPGELLMDFKIEGTVEAFSPMNLTNEIDTVYIRRAGANTEIFIDTAPDATPDFLVPLAEMEDFVLNTGPGEDHVTVDFTAGNPLAAGGMTLNGGSGADTLVVIGDGNPNAFTYSNGLVNFGSNPIQTISVSDVSLSGGGGNDQFTVGGGDMDTNISANLIIAGGAGTDSLTLSDADDTGDDNYDLTQTSAAKTFMTGSITSNTLESMYLDANEDDNNINIESNVSLTVAANGGADVINISPVARTLFNIGSADITVNGGVGYDVMNVFDLNFAGPASFTVTPNTVVLPFNGAETPYSGLEAIEIVAGSGANQINVSNTNAATAVKINSGGGVDNFFVNGTAPGTEVQIRTGEGDDVLTVNSDNVQTAGVRFSGSETLGSMFLGNGGHLRMAGDGDFVLKTKSLTLNNTSYIDLADNSMIVDYTGATSLLPAVQSALTTGFAGGAWNGNGIRSSSVATTPNTALGFAEATDLFGAFPATFAGEPIDNTSVLIRYTRNGDATLDRNVNISDFSSLAANFNVANTRWSRGNFNYDGVTNIADFSALAANFNQALPGELPRAAPTKRGPFGDRLIESVIEDVIAT